MTARPSVTTSAEEGGLLGCTDGRRAAGVTEDSGKNRKLLHGTLLCRNGAGEPATGRYGGRLRGEAYPGPSIPAPTWSENKVETREDPCEELD